MNILFFIGAFESGGRERRLIELLAYLNKNTDYKLNVVIRRNKIEYPSFYELEIPYKILTEHYKKGDKTLHFKFYKICKELNPDVVHVWGNMPAFVSIPAIKLLGIPLINSQISDAPINIKRWSLENIINKINFLFSEVILGNSHAGLSAYGIESLKKSKVIHNGVNLNRFENIQPILETKLKYKITTTYAVIMAASFSEYKDYDLFFRLAEIATKNRDDITFIGVGGTVFDDTLFKRMVSLAMNNQKILFPGKIEDVESLINACDIGVLFSPNGEGISNAIIEYMSLRKPVIANDTGGNKEIIKHGVSGYLTTTESPEEIVTIIYELLNDKQKRIKMGNAGRKLIEQSFSIDRMGEEFVNVYKDLILTKTLK